MDTNNTNWNKFLCFNNFLENFAFYIELFNNFSKCNIIILNVLLIIF